MISCGSKHVDMLSVVTYRKEECYAFCWFSVANGICSDGADRQSQSHPHGLILISVRTATIYSRYSLHVPSTANFHHNTAQNIGFW